MLWIVGWFGPRKTVGVLFFAGALVSNIIAYDGLLEWLDNIKLFLTTMPVPGFLTNGVFALVTIWLLELREQGPRCVDGFRPDTEKDQKSGQNNHPIKRRSWQVAA